MTRRRLRYAVAVALSSASPVRRLRWHRAATRTRAPQFRAHLIGYNEVPVAEFPGSCRPRAYGDRHDDHVHARLRGSHGPTVGVPHPRGTAGCERRRFGLLLRRRRQAACPASNSGTVSGSIAAADVVGPTGQGFVAGDITPVIAALRAGVTYANMHTAKFPAGEIRGQVVPGKHGDGSSEGDG